MTFEIVCAAIAINALVIAASLGAFGRIVQYITIALTCVILGSLFGVAVYWFILWIGERG